MNWKRRGFNSLPPVQQSNSKTIRLQKPLLNLKRMAFYLRGRNLIQEFFSIPNVEDSFIRLASAKKFLPTLTTIPKNELVLWNKAW